MLVRASALARLSRLPPRGRRRLSSIPDWLVDPPPEPKRQLPLLAIVGTPNVGKSTLVNRLCRDNTSWSALRQPALVSPNAGTTRDRLEYRCEWDGTHFRVWDTGGVVGLADTAKGRSALLKAMETQVREAVRRSFDLDGDNDIEFDEYRVWLVWALRSTQDAIHSVDDLFSAVVRRGIMPGLMASP